MDVGIVDISSGIITIIYVILNFFIGLKISSTYKKRKMVEYLYVGIAWLGIGFPLIPDVLKFIFSFYNPPLSDFFLISLYAIFNIILIPFVVLFWLIALTRLFQLNDLTRRIILICYAIFSMILEIFIIFFLFTDIDMIGKTGTIPFQVTWSTLSDIVLLSNLGVVLITGFLFARALIISQQNTMKLRGKILLFAFSTFIIGSIIDMLYTTAISNIIARAILMVSSLEFYLGFLFPKWLENYSQEK
jgi:hypothetical protein